MFFHISLLKMIFTKNYSMIFLQVGYEDILEKLQILKGNSLTKSSKTKLRDNYYVGGRSTW